MIELEHVTKRYGQVTALRDVSLRVGERECVGLLGRNGAGKTTALNLMTGYFPPDEGQVRIGGLSMLEHARECKRKIGYLPEKPPLYDEMTVESYLRFVCELREVARAGIPAHVSEILALCGLEEVRGRVLGHLSKGYRQRAGIAQALCGSPDVLILDEPTVGLDPKQTVEIRELIRALAGEHTVIFSSHILSEVQQLCSRVIILNEGRMVRDFDRRMPENGLCRIRVKIAGKEETVIAALKRMDPEIAVEQLPAEESGIVGARLCVSGDAAEAVPRVFRMLAASSLPVMMMAEERESLEDVFLRETQ